MSRPLLPLLATMALLVLAVPPAAGADDLEPTERVLESTLLEAGEPPLVDLAYDWTLGQTETWNVEAWSSEVTWLGKWRSSEEPAIPLRMVVRITVRQTEADGSALVESEVVEASVMDRSAGAEAAALDDELQTLVGASVRERYDRKGYSIASPVVDPEGETSEGSFARTSALGLLEDLVVRLPLEPIGVGGTWTEVATTTGTDDPDGTETFTNRLVSIDAEGRLAIESDTVVDIPEQGLPMDELDLEEEAIVSGEGSTTNSYLIDPARVAPAWSAEREATIDVDMPVGDGVVLRGELLSAVRALPSGWDDVSWPPLAAVPEPPAPAPTPSPEPALSEASGLIEVTVHDLGAEPRRVLRYDLQAGQVEHSVTVMRMGMRTTLDGEWTPWVGVPPLEMAGTTTVTAVRDDGSYDIEIVYTDVDVPAGSAQLSASELEVMESEISSLLGLRQVLHIDDRGRILSAETVMPAGASTDAPQASQLDAASEQFIDPLPEEAVGPGAVWEVAKESTEAMGFATTGTTTYMLARSLPDGRLELEGDLSMTAQPGPMTVPEMEFLDATIERFSTDGELTKTLDLGLVTADAAVQALSDYAFSVAVGSTSETTEMQMSMEIESRLLSVSGDEGGTP